MDKEKLIKREVRRCKADGGRVYTISLADLVMMQMVGDFDAFLNMIVSRTDPVAIAQVIEDTRKNVTTPRLFSGIVNKTIEAQFGNKYATIRELGQNAIDSYHLSDIQKPVRFHVCGDTSYLVLRIRDYGCGMQLKDLVKDLLIPYNSGKEFDPTKIGEHGIGWYSIVDVADLVKVTTRTQGVTCQALIYNNGEWQATIHPLSSNGFSKKFDRHDFGGTEVSAYVQSMTNNDIIHHLYQFLGTVDRSYDVVYNSHQINSVAETYRRGMPVETTINKKHKPLVMSVSKREIRGNYSDERFKHRNQNLHKVLYTQRGLFIKYDDPNFEQETIHHKLIFDMMQMGLDFWIDIPEHVGLTKGRNNIVADHTPIVLDSTYKAFENVFLDILLEDDEVLEHSSGALMASVAQIFERKYAFRVREVQKNRYSLKRRMSSLFAAALSSCIDAIRSVLTVLATMIKFAVCDLPKLLWQLGKLEVKLSKDVLVKTAFVIGILCFAGSSTWGVMLLYKSFGWAPFLYMLYFLIIEAAGCGAYYLLKSMLKYSVHCAMGLRVVFQYLGTNAIRDIIDFGRGTNVIFQTLMRNLSWDKMSDIGVMGICLIPVYIALCIVQIVWHTIKWLGLLIVKGLCSLKHPALLALRGLLIAKVYVIKWWMAGLHFIGLYIHMEEKRERKRLKYCRRISKRYLSFMHKDAFFKRIVHKKMINATTYYSEAEAARQRDDSMSSMLRTSFVETLNDVAGIFSLSDTLGQLIPTQDYTSHRYHGLSKQIQKRQVKISIDDVIQYYLEMRLKYQKDNSSLTFHHGDVFVQYKNPLIQSIIDKMEQVSVDIRNQYDVSILEDHLDNIGAVLVLFGLMFYFMTGIGFAHMILSFIFRSRVNNPFLKVKFYIKTRDFIVTSARWLFIEKKVHVRLVRYIIRGIKHCIRQIPDTLNELRKRGASALKIVVTLPFILIGKTARFMFVNVIVPVCCMLNPLRYPTYVAFVFEKVSITVIDFFRNIRQPSRQQAKQNHDGYIAKQKETERAKVKQSKKMLKALLKNASMFEKFYHSWVEWFHNSALFYFFGDGSYRGKDFEGMSKAKLANIVQLVRVAKGYYDYYCMIEAMDEEICRALHKKLYKISFTHHNRLSHVHSHMIALDRDLQVNIGASPNYATPVIQSYFRSQTFDHKSEKSIETFALHLMDAMIHLRAHRHASDAMQKQHSITFHKEKVELRRRVVKYFLENNIRPLDIVKRHLGTNEEIEDVFYKLDSVEFSCLAKMTIRRLKHEKLKYDVAREQIRLEKEEQKRKAAERKAEEAKEKQEEEKKKQEEKEEKKVEEIVARINRLQVI